MKSIFSFLSLSALSLTVGILAVSCSFPDEDDDTDPIETGSIRINLDNVVGDRDLQLDSTKYTNAAGEEFTVNKLNYYISNIKLIKIDGSAFTVPQDSSYFLVREGDASSRKIRINHVLTGEYIGMEFMIGVDSLRSVADISKRKGILDKDMGPTNEEAMYWDWNPGYIFLKMEGSADSASTPNGNYYYHIGGFGGLTERTLNNIRTIKLNFTSQKAIVTTTLVSDVYLKADILKIFNGPKPFSIKENSGVMFTPFSATIADNYATMFSFDRIDLN